MTDISIERMKQVVSRLGLYVLTGLVCFTVLRLMFLEYGVIGWPVTVVSLLVTLFVLEVLTLLGWLSKPLGEE